MNNADEALMQMSRLVAANTKTTSILGARAMVLGKFFDAVLPYLTKPQFVEITSSFRQCIDDTMSLMDDVPLTAEYHSSLLELTNAILAALAKKSAVYK